MGQAQSLERVDTVVIGAGQAGLSVGYHLARLGIPFVILEAHARIGDAWRRRWDSLRLFTPARFDGLPGMPFPAPPASFPTKDEFAAYLEAYADRFGLSVRTGVRVERLARRGGALLVEAGATRIEAENVVVAMASFQERRVPSFAAGLAPEIVQLHSFEYRSPAQLREGGVLVVGAGNSGAELALESARAGHRTWLSGRHPGHVPFRIDGLAARLVLVRLVLRVLFHRVLTIATPLGRRARPHFVSHGGPLIRVKPRDLDAAGVSRVPRVAGVRDGKPILDDGRALPAENVIWCTGYHPGLSWIDLPVIGPGGEPRHEAGVVASVPGLFFVGLNFLYAASSTMIHGVGRDAERIARLIAERAWTSVPARRARAAGGGRAADAPPPSPSPPEDAEGGQAPLTPRTRPPASPG
jgi:putative flavoprotein involved in K+ transport